MKKTLDYSDRYLMESIFTKVFFIFTSSFLVSFLLNFFVIKLSNKFNITSITDFRRKKKNKVPLMGGLPIYISVAITTFTFNLESFYPLVISSIPLIFVGIVDDIKEINAKIKIAGHLITVGLWITLTGPDSLILTQVGFPLFLSIPITAFWIIGIINALNMIDGMDCEAIGFSLAAAVSYIAVVGIATSSLPLFAFIGAGVGFLLYNLPPAKLYLGDSGSTFIGFALASFGANLPLENIQPATILIPLFILAFPEIDAVSAIIRRLRQSSSLSQGDQDHIHHKLIKLGFSVPQIIFMIVFSASYCGLTSLLISKSSSSLNTFGIATLSFLGLSALLSSILLLEFKQAQQVSNYSQTLIKQAIPPTKGLIVDNRSFRVSVFDLLPYYKELQQLGIVPTQSFISDFAHYITNNFKTYQVTLAGSYSVIIIENTISNSTNDNIIISNNFYKLLEQHNIKKNNTGLPWGLAFFTEKNNGHKVLDKFKIQHFPGPVTSIKKTG